jgi:non-canonical (house-cleaning) NTP pyrophosphatase
VQGRFGWRALGAGGQQKCQAGVCSQRCGLEDEVELAHERVMEAVQACCGEAHVVL